MLGIVKLARARIPNGKFHWSTTADNKYMIRMEHSGQSFRYYIDKDANERMIERLIQNMERDSQGE